LLVLRAPDGVDRSLPSDGVQLVACAPGLPASGSIAARLRDASGDTLDLEDLTTLDPPDARLLGSWRGGQALVLRGISELDAVCAGELARSRGALDLGGLTTLDAATAGALARHAANGEGHVLRLDGVADPAPEVLRALAPMRGWGLSLGGLRALDLPRVEALAGIAVARLELGGLAELDLATARSIAAHWRNKWLVVTPDARIAAGATSALQTAQITVLKSRAN
jgi:hypothetical protein